MAVFFACAAISLSTLALMISLVIPVLGRPGLRFVAVFDLLIAGRIKGQFNCPVKGIFAGVFIWAKKNILPFLNQGVIISQKNNP
jgi:hypothetical protein